jgi:hypothetical protein
MVYHLILLPCASDYCTRSSKRLKSILLSLRSICRNDPPYYLRTKTYSTSKTVNLRASVFKFSRTILTETSYYFPAQHYTNFYT